MKKKFSKRMILPFYVLVLLIPFNLFIHKALVSSGLINENQGVGMSVMLIVTGLLIGLFGLIFRSSLAWYFKALIALLYVPTVMFSLIISGM
ncbi:hypothetical protein [Leucothrix arctica]|nr:hypothetical protein [Leucothrix arctica]